MLPCTVNVSVTMICRDHTILHTCLQYLKYNCNNLSLTFVRARGSKKSLGLSQHTATGVPVTKKPSNILCLNISIVKMMKQTLIFGLLLCCFFISINAIPVSIKFTLKIYSRYACYSKRQHPAEVGTASLALTPAAAATSAISVLCALEAHCKCLTKFRIYLPNNYSAPLNR